MSAFAPTGEGVQSAQMDFEKQQAATKNAGRSWKVSHG